MMPNRKNVVVSRLKLTAYLLSATHAVGRAKYNFFRRFGFNDSNETLLEAALHEVANSGNLAETLKTTHGTKYVIDGSVNVPNGRRITLRTIWIIRQEGGSLDFVTAYPK